jgi:hypothetical protein
MNNFLFSTRCWLSLFSLICLFSVASAQNGAQKPFICGTQTRTPNPSNSKSLAKGQDFTPKGTLRILVVYVGFEGFLNTGIGNDNHPIGGWAPNSWGGDYEMPEYVTYQNGVTKTSKLLFNDVGDFTNSNIMSVAENQRSISNSLNLMSKPNQDFKFIANVFSDPSGKPVLVKLNPSDPNVSSAGDWTTLNAEAYKKMLTINSNPAYYQQFDQRVNNPRYNSDNSANNSPDGTIDFVVFMYRYSSGWGTQPVLNMNGWPGANGGRADVGYFDPSAINPNFPKLATGFILAENNNVPRGIFMHELFHCMFDAPHYGGANGEDGYYFKRASMGLGTMCESGGNMPTYPIMHAGERYRLGYDNVNVVSTNGVYTIGDYITTIDPNQKRSIRIKLEYPNPEPTAPVGSLKRQYLWIQYHAKLNPLDEHQYAGKNIGPGTINHPSSSAGVYMFVEDIDADLNSNNSGEDNCYNLISARGNFDYQRLTPSFITDATVDHNNWGNSLYQFNQGLANPLSGQSECHYKKYDKNLDNTIGYREGDNILRLLEGNQNIHPYRAFGGNDPAFGKPSNFQLNDEVRMGSNPSITNYPIFRRQLPIFPERFSYDPIYLNGISIKIISMANGQVSFDIKFDETRIKNDVRFTGNIVLPDIANAPIDCELGTGLSLLINRTGTVNNNSLLPNNTGTFFKPTIFKIAQNAKMFLGAVSNTLITDQTKMSVSNQGKLTVYNGATCTLDQNSDFTLETGATLQVEGAGQFIVKNGSRLIINAGSFVSLNGKIIIQNGGKLIVNGNFNYTGTGHFRFENGNQFELNADVVFTGIGAATPAFVVAGDANLKIASAYGIKITNCGIVGEEGSSIGDDILTIQPAPSANATANNPNTQITTHLVFGTENAQFNHAGRRTLLGIINPKNQSFSFRNTEFNISNPIWEVNAIEVRPSLGAAVPTFDYQGIDVDLNNCIFTFGATAAGTALNCARSRNTYIDNCSFIRGRVELHNTYWLQMNNSQFRGNLDLRGAAGYSALKIQDVVHNWISNNTIIDSYYYGIDASQGYIANIIMQKGNTIENCYTGIKLNGSQYPLASGNTLDFGLLGVDCSRFIQNHTAIEGNDIIFSVYSNQNANVFVKKTNDPSSKYFKSIFYNRYFETDLWFLNGYFDGSDLTNVLPDPSYKVTDSWEFWENHYNPRIPWQGTLHFDGLITDANDSRVVGCGGTLPKFKSGGDAPFEKTVVIVDDVPYDAKIQMNAAYEEMKNGDLEAAKALFEPIAYISNEVKDTSSKEVKHFIDVAQAIVIDEAQMGRRKKVKKEWLPQARVQNTRVLSSVSVLPNPANQTFEALLPEGEFEMVVFDAIGKLIIKQVVTDRQKIDISKWQNGIYLIKFEDKTKKEVASSKLVVQH